MVFFDPGQRFTYVLTDDDNGTFGVDSNGNLYKATSKTNFETKTLHRITVTISDTGYPSLKVFFNSPLFISFVELLTCYSVTSL